jgi:hypothetical protein
MPGLLRRASSGEALPAAALVGSLAKSFIALHEKRP